LLRKIVAFTEVADHPSATGINELLNDGWVAQETRSNKQIDTNFPDLAQQ
jgi:hypothetical protein